MVLKSNRFDMFPVAEIATPPTGLGGSGMPVVPGGPLLENTFPTIWNTAFVIESPPPLFESIRDCASAIDPMLTLIPGTNVFDFWLLLLMVTLVRFKLHVSAVMPDRSLLSTLVSTAI